MTELNGFIDDFHERRAFFQKHFPLKIGRQRTDVKSEDVLKNSCPVCGYLTLNERNIFDICAICFWEDDGIDDFEENEDSGPNHMTLKEGRRIFREAKWKLMRNNYPDNHFMSALKFQFGVIDNLIEQNSTDTAGIVKQLHTIIHLLENSEVNGLDTLFNEQSNSGIRYKV